MMEMKSNQKQSNPIRTDDLALSAYLRLKGYTLIRSEMVRAKRFFIFDIDEEKAAEEKVTFIQSDLLKFYNELRNLKKLL
jgi:hypothetical protein